MAGKILCRRDQALWRMPRRAPCLNLLHRAALSASRSVHGQNDTANVPVRRPPISYLPPASVSAQPLALAPTGGYLIGMLCAAGLGGRLADLGWDRSVVGTVGAMVIGNVVIYAFGVSWLAAALQIGVGEAISKGATPFLIGDAIKIALAAGIFPSAWWYVNNGRSAGPR